MRLDRYMQEVLQEPRNQVEQLIKQHGVLIDGKPVRKCGYRLKEGEEIFVTFPEKERHTVGEIDFDVEIIYEDEVLMIINKPSGLTVHPAPSVKGPTLVDWLRHKGVSLSTLSGEERHGIVHRIDKETSGALVIAKTNEAHLALSRQLEDKSMGRYYLAIIDQPLKESCFVEKKITRNPRNRIKMMAADTGREAKSAFLKIATAQNRPWELIAAKLFTGRTHQIRVHLASIGRHILADTTYGFKSKKDKISRIMLHAYIIYFIHPVTGKKIFKRAPIPKDFENVLGSAFVKEEIDEKTAPDTLIDAFDTLCERLQHPKYRA